MIPWLKEINPNLEETFEHNIRRFADTELVLQQTVTALREKMLAEKQGEFHLSIKSIRELQPRHLLLFELLRPFNFSEAVTAELLASLDKQSGTSFYSSSHRVTVNRQNLIITAVSASNAIAPQLIHPQDEVLGLPAMQLLISRRAIAHFEKDPNKAYVDADKLIFPLVLRSWQPGDRFKPMGMNGFKKLSDFFIDQKIPLANKDQVPVLVNGNGEVIWLAGLRQDNRYRLTESTKSVTIFELQHLKRN
ncbi:tRNA(Ile)-lysidine synthase [compost metagenome]